jgi:hydrogenase-4 component B
VLGLLVVAGPTSMMARALSHPEAATALTATADILGRIALISGGLFLALAVILWWRLRPAASRKLRKHVTWGCGYDAPNPRMQYTGASFSIDFAAHFRNIMVLIKRRKAPAGYFPTDSYAITDCVDAVERRLYSVINHGDETATDVSRKMQEDDPRFAFSAGLAALVILAALVLLAEGVLP